MTPDDQPNFSSEPLLSAEDLKSAFRRLTIEDTIASSLEMEGLSSKFKSKAPPLGTVGDSWPVDTKPST
jgi:hypothetical protein